MHNARNVGVRKTADLAQEKDVPIDGRKGLERLLQVDASRLIGADDGVNGQLFGGVPGRVPLVVEKGAVDPSDAEICDLTLNAGDAFLFENRLFHTAAPNVSDRCSKVLMYGYAYRWMKPEVYLENPDERELMTAHPIARQLLGGYRDIDTPAWGLNRWAKRHGVMPETVPWTVEA